ncbi:MAG: hypothetical protein ABR577_00080 [Pyrinomonadaceae bacterium]
MRRIIIVVLALLLSGQQMILLAVGNVQSGTKTQAQAASVALSNEDVLEMLKAGLSPEIVVAKIKTSIGKFDTAPAALQRLKAANVPDAVILAMVNASSISPISNQLIDAVPVLPKKIEVKLTAGTPLEIELAHSVSSADVESGSLLSFRVLRSVKVNGVTAIENGALVTGRIVKATRSKSWGRGGRLAWSVQDVVAADGQLLPLQVASGTTRGESHAAEIAAGTAVTGALLAPIIVFAPFFAPAILMRGFKKGENAVLPAGRRFEVFLQKDALISVNAATASR